MSSLLLKRGLDGNRVRRLAVAGLVSLATLVGVAIPETASADGPLACEGRNATIIALPGVRSVGTSGADVMVGFPLYRDTLDGRGGGDLICGLDKKDRLYGGKGGDRLRGNGGNDRLRGGDGFDRCVGGKGRDVAIGCEVVRSATVR